MDGLQVCWVHQEVEDESEDDEDEETQLLPGSLRPFEAAGFHSSRQFAAVAAQERSEEAIWSSGLPPQSASSSSEETHPHRNKQIHSCITGKTRSVPSSRQHTASPFLSPSSTSLSSSVAPPDSSFSSSLSSPRLSSSPVALSCEASSSAFPSEASSSSAFPSEASSSAFPSEASSSSVFHSEASSSASSSSTLSSPPPLLSASSPLLKSACRSEPRVLFPSSVLPAVRLPPLPSDRLSKVCSLVSQLSDSSTTTAASRSPEQEVSPPCPPAFRRLATSAYNSYLPSSFSISALSRCSSASPPSSSSSHTSSSFSSSSSSSLSSSSSFSSTSSSLSSSFSATSFSTRSSSFSVHGGSLCSPSPLGCAGFSESLCLSPRCSREPPGSELFNLLDDLESGVVCEFDPPSPNKALREKGVDSSPFSSDVSSPSSPLKSFLSSPRLRHSASTALPRDSLRSSAASPSSPLQAPSSYSSLSSSSASSSSSSFASSSPPTLSPSSSSSPPSSSASSVSFSTPSSSSPNSRFSSSFPRGFSSPSTVSECHPVSTALSCPRSASSASAAATNSVLPLSENARSLFVSPSLSDLADVMAVDFEDVDSGPAPSCSSSSCSSRASFSFSSLSHSSPSPLPASAYCSRPVLRHSAKDTAERRRKDAAESELRRGEDDRTEPHKTWMPERGDAVKEANRTPVQELRHSAEAHQPDTEEISSHFLAFFDDSIPLNHGVHPAEHADRGLTPTSKPEMKSLPDVASSSPSPTPLSFTTAGFRFASGREVTVSEEARRKAREMLQLEAAESEVREQGEQGAGGSMRRDEAGRTDGHETQGIGTTAGFRFASGREVTVSEEARRKAREMLQLEATGREEVCQQTDVANGLGNEVGFTMTGVCTPPGALVSCHPISGSVACIPSVGSPSPSKLFASFAVSSCCATVAGIGPGSVPLVSVLGGCGDCGADLGERDPGRVTGPGTGEETDREPSASHFVRMQSTAQPSCVTNHDEARKFQSSVPSEATECSQVSLPSPSSALRSAPSLSDSSAPAGQPASEVENRSSSSLSSRARPPSLRRRGLTSGLLGVPRLAASGVGAQDARAAVPRDRRHFKAPRRNSQTASLGGQRPRVQERTREDLVKAKQEDASRSEGSGEKEEKQYCFPEAQTNVLRASGTHFSSLFSVSTEPKDLSFPSSACSSSLPQVSDASPLYQNMLVIRRLWELHARRFSICLSPLSRSADPTARVSSSPYPQSPSSLWPPAPLPAAVSPDSRDACERRNFQFSFLDRGLWLVCLPEHLHKRTVPLFCGSLEAARDFLLLSCTARGDECIEDSSGWSRGASSGCRAREDNAGTRAEDGSADGDSGGRSMLVGGVEEFSRMVGTYLQWKREVKRESPSTASSALLEKTRNGKKRRETPELRGNRNRFTRAWVAHHYSLLCLRAAQRWTRSFALSVASYRHESHHRNSCTGSSSTLSHSFLRHPPLQTSAVSLQGPRDAVAPAPPFSSPSRPSACPASVQSFLGPPRPPSPLRLLRALLCRVEAEEEGRRSVLRQVCEGDLSPATPMVLEVLCPPFCSEDPLSLRVSDGWYVVKARVVDPSLAVVLRRIFQRRDNRSHAAQTPHSPPFPRFSFRRIFVQGASLSGLSEPCCPLDLPSQACLLLHASTCRPLFSPLPLLSSPASSLPSFLMATDSKAPLPSAPSPVASCPLFSSLLFAPEWLGKGCASSLASLRGSAFPLGRWLSGRGERKQRTGGREEKEEEERAVPQAVKSLRRGVGGEIPVVDVILLRRGPLLFRVRREVPKPGGSGRPLETREGSRENEHPPENDVGDSEPRETKTVLMTEAEYRAWFQREQETLQRKREEELVLLQEKLEEVRRKTESKKAKRRRTPCLQTREEDDGDGETAESGGKDKTSLRKEAPQREEEGHTCEERDCEATLSEEEAEDELRDLERQLTRLEELWRVDRENLAKKGQSQIDLLVVDSLFLHKLSALALMAFANVATSASAPSHVKASVNCVSFLDASGPPSRSSLCGVDQVAVASSSDPRCVASASSNVPPTVSSSLAPPLAPLPVPPAAASSSSSPSFVSCSSSSNSSSPLAASTSVSASGVSLAPSFGVSQTDIENALDSALEEETETKHHTSTSSSMVSSPSLRASRSTVSPQSSAPAAPFEFAVANSGCRSRRPSDSQQHASEAPHSRTERRDEAKLPTHAKSPPATYARDRSVNSKPCEDLLSLLRLCGCLRPRKVEEETDLRTVAGLARLFRQSLACITLSGDPATEEETPFHELQEGERVKISNLACSPAASVYSTRQRRHGQEPDRGGGGGGTGKWTDEWSELNAAEEERRLGVIDCHGNQRLVRLHGTKRTAFQIVRLAPGSALSPHPSGSHPAVSSPHVSAFFPSPPSSSPPSSSRYPSCSSRPFASPSLSRSPPSSSLVRLLPVCTAGSGGSRPLPFAVPLSVLSTSLRASLAAFSSALSPLRSPSSSAALSPSAGASAASGAAERENCQLGEGARSNLFADGPTPGAEREGERREEANDGEPSEELDEAEGGKKRQQGRGRRRAPSSSVKGALDATAQKRQKRQLAELPRHCCAAAKDFEQTERGASPSGSDLGCKEKRERLTTRLSAKRSTCRPPDSGPGAETKEESKRRNAEDKGTKVESAFLLSALSQWLLPLSSLDVLLGLCHLPLFSQAHRLACLLKEADREREREQEVLQREEKEASTATEGRRLRERGELTLRPRKEMFFRGEAANHVRERDERRAQDRGRWPHFPETQVLNERLSKSGEEGKENVWQQLADAESVIAKGILKGQASESMQCLQRHGLKGSEQTESCVSPPDSLYRFTAPPISIGILPAVAYDLVGVLLLLEDHQVSPLLGSYSADSAQTCSAFVGSERHASPSGLVAFLWTSTDQICCIRVKPSRNFSDFSVNSGSHSRLEAPSSSSSSSSSSLASASRSGREATGCSASREAPAGGCPFLLRYRQMLLGAAGRRNAGTTEGVKARQGVTAERAEGLQRWWMFQTEERGKVESGIKEKKHSLTGSVCVSSISSSVAASLSPGFLSLRWALFQNVEFQGRDPNLGIFNFSASPRLLHLASGPLHAPLPSKVSPVFSTSSAYTNSLPFSRNSSSRQFPSSSLPRSSCLNSPFASDSPPPCSTSSSSAAGASSSSVLASSLCPAASPADAHSGLHPYCTEEEEREGEDKSESRDTGGSDSDFGDRKARKKNGVREGREHGVTETSQRVSGQREGARGEKQSGRRPPDSAMRQEDPRKNMRLREERNESEMRNEVDAPASKGSDKEGEREEGDRKVKRQRTTPKRPSCRVEGKEERSITVCAVGMNDCLSEDRTVSTKRAAKPRNQRGEAADFISFETAYGDWKETACFSDRHEFEKANRFSFLQDEICDLFRFLGAPEAAPASSDRRGIDRAKPLLHNDRARLDIQSADQPGGRSEGDKQRPPSDENRPLDRNWDPRCSGKEQLVRGRGALNDWDRAIRGEARELEEERGEKTENGREGRGEAAESDRQGDHVEQCMRSCGGDTALSRLLLALEKVASAVGARRL